MKYEKTIKGIFRDRPNRFIAHVEIEGILQTVHVKNTGRCKELLVSGCTVIMEDFRDRPGFENRKTKFDIIGVYKKLEEDNPLRQGGQTSLFEQQGQTSQFILINMDSQAPNKVVYEWLNSLPAERKYDYIKPEYTYGNSRVDFYMEKGNEKYLMEVKGCTLERNGLGYFPDAPTKRGVKHLQELATASQKGYKCFIAFVIQIPGVKEVFPNIQTHPEFGDALNKAKEAGVEVLFLKCNVWEDGLEVCPC